MSTSNLSAFLLLLFGLFGGGDPGFIEKYLANADRFLEEGKLPPARESVERALEMDASHLGALLMLADIATMQGDTDTTVYALHRWLDVTKTPSIKRAYKSKRRDILKNLLELDSEAKDLLELSDDYVDGLLNLGKQHEKKGRLHSAIELYRETLLADVFCTEAKDSIKEIQRTGGADVAVEDVLAGADDPSESMDAETIADLEAKHSTWKTAFESDTENYRYKTDAGFLVFKTAPIAMEQMNKAYRKFFHYKEDGDPTPKISVLIYKDREEYLEKNGLPENDWTGGFFNGSSVQTFVGGKTGKETILGMYGTLFHEAAHQFVSLTGKGGVPGWLNEAYASFFEGTTILSNGSVKWNQVASHRLFPLASRMKNGWMEKGRDASPDQEGNWTAPDKAPTFRIIVENDYQWGPPWYAPTWGVVYFLYNYRNPETGETIYRKSLHDYYLSGAAGRADPVQHFEEVVLNNSPLSPVQDIKALNKIWKEWILQLQDIQMGKKPSGKSNIEYGELALERENTQLALEFFEEAYLHESENPEVIWKLASLLEDLKKLDRALALYLEFARECELRGITESNENYPIAMKKVLELDPLHRKHQKLQKDIQERGMNLAHSYFDRGFPLMALEISKRLASSFGSSEAREFYLEVAESTGKTLQNWKLIYNEHNLQGWAGSEAYRAYGAQIESRIETKESSDLSEREFRTQELVCDVTFDADFSLEAEVQFGKDSKLAGLCFGRKDKNNGHAVLLHPKGYLDISTQQGGVWKFRDHRTVQLNKVWNKLRIDVVGKILDVYLNGNFLRSLEMPNRQSVRGGFGLLAGSGQAFFQNIRMLSHNPRDPSGEVARKLAMESLASNATSRAPGSFQGMAPPALNGLHWVQGDPVHLADFLGRPAALIFWAPYQDKVIPSAAFYSHLWEQWAPLDFHFIVVSSGQHSPQETKDWLQKHPMPGLPVAMDISFLNYPRYNLGVGGFGLPRILLLGPGGKVVWEGDPGLTHGAGWKEGDSETYLDTAIEDLAEACSLEDLQRLAPQIPIAHQLLAQGKLKETLLAISELADLDAKDIPEIFEARRIRNEIEALGATLPQQAQTMQEEGYPMTAEFFLHFGATEFPGTATGALCAARLKALQKSPSFRKARKAWKALERAVKLAASKADDRQRIEDYLSRASIDCDVRQTREALQALREGLSSNSLPAIWADIQPNPPALLNP